MTMPMKVRMVGGPLDGREYEAHIPPCQECMFPFHDFTDETAPIGLRAVWVAENETPGVYDPDGGPHDEPYMKCADGKYRQRTFSQAVYRLEQTATGAQYRFCGLPERTRKVYDPAVKAFVYETISAVPA